MSSKIIILLYITLGVSTGSLCAFIIGRIESQTFTLNRMPTNDFPKDNKHGVQYGRWLQEGATRDQWLQCYTYENTKDSKEQDSSLGLLDLTLIQYASNKKLAANVGIEEDGIVLSTPIKIDDLVEEIMKLSTQASKEDRFIIANRLLCLYCANCDLSDFPVILQSLECEKNYENSLLLRSIYSVWSQRDPISAANSILRKNIESDWGVGILKKWAAINTMDAINRIEKLPINSVLKTRYLANMLDDVSVNTNLSDFEYLFNTYLDDASSKNVLRGTSSRYVMLSFMSKLKTKDPKLTIQLASRIIDRSMRDAVMNNLK